MKSILKSTRPIYGKPLILALVVLMISCTKSSNNPTNTAVKYCKTVSWSDTSGRNGSFTGSLINGQYELTGVTFTGVQQTPASFTFTYDASGHLMNQTGLTVNYNQGVLVNYVIDLSLVSASTGTETYTFNSSGQLTNVTIAGSDASGPISLSSNYTYDSNGDPVHIVGHGAQTIENQVTTVDYDVTANYWENKLALLTPVPIAAPFTVYFNTYGSILSRHLINQMNVTQTTTRGSASEILDLSPVYVYSNDSSGRVATMELSPVHSLSPNVFTFTYTGCN
jgi:hypothetical protein